MIRTFDVVALDADTEDAARLIGLLLDLRHAKNTLSWNDAARNLISFLWKMDVLYSPELCLISDKFLYLRHEQNAGNNAGARLNSFN